MLKDITNDYKLEINEAEYGTAFSHFVVSLAAAGGSINQIKSPELG